MHSWAPAVRLLSVSNYSFFSAAFHLWFTAVGNHSRFSGTAVTKKLFCLPATRLLYCPMGYEVSLEWNWSLWDVLCCSCEHTWLGIKVNFTHNLKPFFFFGLWQTLSVRIYAFIFYLQSYRKGLFFQCDLTFLGNQYSTKKLPPKNLRYQNNKFNKQTAESLT